MKVLRALVIKSVLVTLFLLLNHINLLFCVRDEGGVVVEEPVRALREERSAAALGHKEAFKGKPQEVILWNSPAWKVPDDLGVVDKDVLREEAEAKGYGYKTTNLEELKKLSARLNKSLQEAGSKYEIGVPEFVGISSETMQAFLDKHSATIAKLWQHLLEKYFSDESRRNKSHPMFTSKKFPEGFLADVKRTLVESIERSFVEAGKDSDAHTLGLPGDKKDALDKLIAGAKSNDKRLMVRSTGREDTDKLANAGGNETKANVVPDWQNVIEAMKEVVVSYFSEKSLIQRLGAGDESLFDVPMTPVLVQRMIGEKHDGEEALEEVPRCGVMFTEEPEGGLSRQHPEDTTKTSGITIIQASYGHNEGVVNSIVPVDTYYVDMFGNIFPVIRPKFFRIISLAQSGRLGRSALHNDAWSYVPALKQEEIKVLKLLADALEMYYQGPMDVEYVIDRAGDVPMIWIVQARPIVHNPNQPTPSYLRKEALSEKHVTCEAIGVAGGAVRVIEKPEQCIVRQTIGEALAVYQDDKTDRMQVVCIVIKEHAPKTSHEATTFRSEVKPVVYTKDIATVERWLEENKKIVVDVQQGIIAVWEKAENELSKSTEIGWISYPIPAKMSMWPRMIDSWLKKDEDVLKSPQRIILDPDLFKQFSLIRQNWVFMKKLLSPENLSSMVDKERKSIHTLLYEKLESAVKRQDVLLGRSAEIVHGYSVKTLMTEVRADVAAEKEIGSADKRKVQLLKLKNVALSSFLGERWTAYLTEKFDHATEEDKNALVSLVYTLGQLDALELWFHTEFVRLGVSEVPDIGILLSTCWDDATQNFLKTLAEKKKLLKQTDLKGVADPAKFKKVWDDFCVNTIDYFVTDVTDGFMHGFYTSSITGKIAALQVMSDFVAVFDGALKEMSRSSLFKIFTGTPAANEAERIKINKDKGFVFKKMLNKYLEVLQRWWNLLCRIDPDAATTIHYEDQAGFGAIGSSVLVASALLSINKMLGGVGVRGLSGMEERQFQPSPGYNVAESAIGSSALWERAQPKTLEDVFTFTHQSLLAIISMLSLKTYDPLGNKAGAAIPEPLKYINAAIIQINSSVKLIGTSLEQGVLHLFYNWPQRNHSASINVSYLPAKRSQKEHEIEIGCCFVGQNEYARWDVIADVLKMRSYVQKMPVAVSAEVKTRGVTVTWRGLALNVVASINTIRGLMLLASMIGLSDNNTNIFYKNVADDYDTKSLARYLTFWKQQKHCGLLLSDSLPPIDRDFAAWLVEKLKNDEQYRANSIKLMIKLNRYDNTSSYPIGISERDTVDTLVCRLKLIIEKAHGAADDILALAQGFEKNFNELFMLIFWTSLVNNDVLLAVFFKTPIDAAIKGVASIDSYVREEALKLWQALFKKGKGFGEARALLVGPAAQRKPWLSALSQRIKDNESYDPSKQTLLKRMINRFSQWLGWA